MLKGPVPDTKKEFLVYDEQTGEWNAISIEKVWKQSKWMLPLYYSNPFLSAFLIFQTGERRYGIEPLEYAAYTHAAYTWLVRRWEKPPLIHPLYGDIGTDFQVVQSAHEAYERQLVPVYWAELGFLAVPIHLI
jgi:hypothetical protein